MLEAYTSQLLAVNWCHDGGGLTEVPEPRPPLAPPRRLETIEDQCGACIRIRRSVVRTSRLVRTSRPAKRGFGAARRSRPPVVIPL
jgi:hypothetical protein